MPYPKRVWTAWATSIEPASENVASRRHRACATLRVRVTTDEHTPYTAVGREIDVELSAPMLQEICRVAREVGAVYHVEVVDPFTVIREDVARQVEGRAK